MRGLFAKKLGMTRVFTSEGHSVPVTVLHVEPNVIHQVKSNENDGYRAVQVGVGQQKAQRVNRAMTGHMAKAKKGFSRMLREIRLDLPGFEDESDYEVGGELTLDGFCEVGSKVDVVGNTVGKGFAGVMKRHGMKGAVRTHGTHEYFRHGGSIGNRKFPGRVFKNKRMPGHMGDVRVIQEGLEVVAVRGEDNALLVKGSVPGNKNSYVFVRQSLKH